MAYYNDGKVFRNLPEQVEKNKDDIETIQTAQKTDESNINTNLNNINAHETRLNALESLKMTQDGQNIKLTKSTGEIGNIAVGTVAGTNLLGGNDVTFKTINGEAITGDGNLAVDTGLSSLLWANLGIGRWEDHTIYDWTQGEFAFYDELAPYYTNITQYMSEVKCKNGATNTYFEGDVVLANNFNTSITMPCSYAFEGTTLKKLVLSSMTLSAQSVMTFANNLNLTEIAVKDGCTVKLTGSGGWAQTFKNCPKLTTIGAIDIKDLTFLGTIFGGTPNITSLGFYNINQNLNLYTITALEEDAVKTLFNNLLVVTDKIITLSSAVFNRLSTDTIAIATGKGWTIAKV